MISGFLAGLTDHLLFGPRMWASYSQQHSSRVLGRLVPDVALGVCVVLALFLTLDRRPYCMAVAAIQMSLAGIGVPLSHSALRMTA